MIYVIFKYKPNKAQNRNTYSGRLGFTISVRIEVGLQIVDDKRDPAVVRGR